MVGNAWKYRPERQARLQADMQNPEWVRRGKMYREARGAKKKRIAQWNVAWNLAGRPAAFPDFDAWALQQKDRWAAEAKQVRAMNKSAKEAHARYLASLSAEGK